MARVLQLPKLQEGIEKTSALLARSKIETKSMILKASSTSYQATEDQCRTRPQVYW